MAGLQKVGGRGKNSSAKLRSDTKSIVIGSATFSGKNYKKGLYLAGSLDSWHKGIGSQPDSPRQRPGSLKCR